MTECILIFSQASEDLPLPENGPDLGPLPSAKSTRSARKSSKQGSGLLPTPQQTDCTTAGLRVGYRRADHSIGSLQEYLGQFSSQTSEISTAPNSERQLCLPGDSLASLFPSLGSEKARQMTVTSGRKCSALYQKPGPLGLLARMLLVSSTWSSNKCVLTWKAKAMKSSRLLFQLAPSMRRTGGIESGLLVTPTVMDSAGFCGKPDKGRTSPNSGRTLTGQVLEKFGEGPHAMLPTPRAGKTTDETEQAWGKRKAAGAVATSPLALAIRFLKTPSAVETESEVMEIRPGCDGHYKLRDQIAMIPTPRAEDSECCGAHRGKADSIYSAIKMLPTPQGADAERKGGDFARANRPGSGGDDLTTAVRRGSNRGMRLQPAFVEWMMGYPKGWTKLDQYPPKPRQNEGKARRQEELTGSRPSGMPSSPKSSTKS